MNRRQLKLGGTAAAADLAGAGVAWWQFQPHGAPVAASGEGATRDPFWAQSFDTPDGASLALASFSGKPLLVNFWATWCPPCVEELPLIDRFHTENRDRKWQVLGLAVDQPSAVRTWLQRKPLGFPVVMAGLQGTELSKSLGNLAGGLPFTVVFGASGQLLHRKSGQVSSEDLAQWAQLT
ncbi:TlpA disulfide reductase family protein [Polaromonas sp.]|uniref:TlpA family protein disulfide reductase n=1 Tax=Polaromonas sp. TaxID=1869339 RepID=UPI002730662B|nr:TlpA disulfide reductase family protein [Polaromonas sp.]MDP1740431.1 TlpA disulfide reductase family protein [Polaromonas sp.]